MKRRDLIGEIRRLADIRNRGKTKEYFSLEELLLLRNALVKYKGGDIHGQGSK